MTRPQSDVRDHAGAKDRIVQLLAEGGSHLHGECAAAIDTAAALKRVD